MLLVHQELLMMLDHHLFLLVDPFLLIAFDDEDLDTYNSPFADQFMGAKADFNNMEPSTVEPTKIAQALDDESWVEAMQKRAASVQDSESLDTRLKQS
ncbi:hypothetical protein Tco_0050646, partial [Tanacetum coccineum]